MREKDYIVTKTKSGILVKRYFKKVKTQDGKVNCVFYYAKRMNVLEKGKYYISGIIKNNSSTKIKLCAGIGAGIIAFGLVFGGVQMANSNSVNNDNETYFETIKSEQSLPVAEIYTNSSGQEFITLDSALEISRYNYEMLIDELAKYNATASNAEKYNFDTNKFNYATFVGVQIRESSLKVNDKKDGKCKGCFKIGEDATKEANEVAIKLTGEPIITSNKDYDDPVKSNKACMYIYIKNYEYVYGYINNHNLNIYISPQIIIDEYLFGCGNMFKELSGEGYAQKQYSKDILEYEKILANYGKELFVDGLINKEHQAEYSKVYQKLNAVTEDKQK